MRRMAVKIKSNNQISIEHNKLTQLQIVEHSIWHTNNFTLECNLLIIISN